MISKKALVASVAAALMLVFLVFSPARADIPSWFWDALINFSTTTNARLDALEADVQTLNITVAQQQVYISLLESYLEVDEITNPAVPVVRVVAANLQVVNGGGATDTVNGLGNLIVGYDESNTLSNAICSDGQYLDPGSCVAQGETWSAIHKTGSHNIVLGTEANYSQFGGIVAGRRNSINRGWASVTGGVNNIASGEYSSVSGGGSNVASGNSASTSGGLSNIVSGDWASISGGQSNDATADYTTVTGGLNNSSIFQYAHVSAGQNNIASGERSAVTGGMNNTASGDISTVTGGLGNLASSSGAAVTGGFDNTASNNYANVSGGRDNTASGEYASVTGGQNNFASTVYSSVGGGFTNIASGAHSTVSGGANRSVTDQYDWRAGSLFETQ